MSGKYDLRIGDEVVITSYKNNRCGYSNDMRRYIGMTGKITGSEFSIHRNCWFYKIDADCGHWWWDERNMKPAFIHKNLPDFECACSDELGAFLM